MDNFISYIFGMDLEMQSIEKFKTYTSRGLVAVDFFLGENIFMSLAGSFRGLFMFLISSLLLDELAGNTNLGT